MTIKAKLLGVFFGSILCICIVLAAVLMHGNSVSNRATGALAEKFNELEHLQGVSIAFKTQVQEWKNILLRGADPKQKEKYTKGFNEQSELIRKGVDELKPILTGENAQLLAEFAQAHDQLASKYMSAKQEFLDGAQFDAKAADHAVKGLDRKVLDPIEKLLKNLADEVHQEVDTSKKALNDVLWSSLAIALSIAVVVLVFGWRIVTYLSDSLSRLTEKLIELSGSLNGNAGKITQAGGRLSASSTEQASAVHETSVAARQISSMLERSTENAKNAIQSVEVGQSKSREGLQAVNAVLGAIGDIHSSNQQLATAISASNKNLSNITSVIADIGNKTKVIHDIVFQTKLLSFNASVEAARAGEHGKGFAVVAEEIGSLAQMSGGAAQEIAQLLAESLQSVSAVIGDTQRQLDELTAQSRAKVEAGEQVANECGRAIEEVSRQIQEVASISSSIAQATSEQAQGVQQIANAMSQLNETSEQTAAVAGQTDHVASSLNEQSRELNELVSELQTMIGGQESRAA